MKVDDAMTKGSTGAPDHKRHAKRHDGDTEEIGAEPFTLKIITRDGLSYYEVQSAQLGELRPIDDFMRQLVENKTPLFHKANEIQPAFSGTFYVNLSIFQ